MSTAVDVLTNEINILRRAIKDAHSKRSLVQKAMTDQLADVEKELHALLVGAGVSAEYDALMSRKAKAIQHKDENMVKIQDHVDAASRIANYLSMRVDTLKKSASEG